VRGPNPAFDPGVTLDRFEIDFEGRSSSESLCKQSKRVLVHRPVLLRPIGGCPGVP